MRNALILLSVVLILFTIACNRKYTCADAPFHCASCRSDTAEHINIPWTIIEISLPQACILSLKTVPVKDISSSGDVKTDMQSMVSTYYSHNERNRSFNRDLQSCMTALTEQSRKNVSVRIRFCESRSYIYDPNRGVCIQKP